MLQAIYERQFYVFTHADYHEAIEVDFALMFASMQRSADPNYRDDLRLVTSINR